MSTLSLRIQLEGGRVTKTIQFHPNTTVFDACKIIRDKFAEAVQGQRKYIQLQHIMKINQYLFVVVA